MSKGLQESGVAQQAAQALLENLHVLQHALEQEVAQELGHRAVAEEGQVHGGGRVKQLAQLLVIARADDGGHCTGPLGLEQTAESASRWEERGEDVLEGLCRLDLRSG